LKPTEILSADTIGGWLGHYRRMKRWQKLAGDYSKGHLTDQTEEAIDFCLAYFLWAHSFKEWLIETSPIDKVALENELKSQPAWAMCSDLANRTRHYNLTRNPTDNLWKLVNKIQIGNSHGYRGGGHFSWHVVHNGSVSDVFECVTRVSNMWGEILTKFGLEQTP